MNRLDYILSSANLPFDLGSLEPEANILFAAAPRTLMAKLANARSHADEVLAGDKVAEWISNNWRHHLPDIAARFPAK